MAKRPTPIDEEVVWDKSKIIKSKTDSKGIISYVNNVFVDVCGYSKEELLGKPHNIIRHPDMPKVIFKVLWENLQKGLNFNAIVKNLAKSGKYYWIITNFDIFKTPNGIPSDFLGVRNSVPNEVVEEVAPLYEELLKVEKEKGVEESEKLLHELLKDKGGDYTTYVKNIMSNSGVDVSFW